MVSTTQAIGARIATLGLSQRKLAAMLGVSQPALNGWLNGHTRPPTRIRRAGHRDPERGGGSGTRRGRRAGAGSGASA